MQTKKKHIILPPAAELPQVLGVGTSSCRIVVACSHLASLISETRICTRNDADFQSIKNAVDNWIAPFRAKHLIVIFETQKSTVTFLRFQKLENKRNLATRCEMWYNYIRG